MVDLFGSGIKNKKLAQEENVRKPVKGLVHKGTGYNEFSQRQYLRQGATCIKPEYYNCYWNISTYVLLMQGFSEPIFSHNPRGYCI